MAGELFTPNRSTVRVRDRPPYFSTTCGQFANFPLVSLNLRHACARHKNGPERCANTVSSPNHSKPVWRPALADLSPITTAVFWSKVSIPKTRVDCWEWTETTNSNGYGRFFVAPHWVSAHRLSYELLKGPIPDGLHIRHLCHNRLCCNPDHLDVGTPKQNAQDSLDAGRTVRGARHPKSKLRDGDVVFIRQNPEKLTTKELASRFGVSVGTVSNIRTGKIWRHVAA